MGTISLWFFVILSCGEFMQNIDPYSSGLFPGVGTIARLSYYSCHSANELALTTPVAEKVILKDGGKIQTTIKEDKCAYFSYYVLYICSESN